MGRGLVRRWFVGRFAVSVYRVRSRGWGWRLFVTHVDRAGIHRGAVADFGPPVWWTPRHERESGGGARVDLYGWLAFAAGPCRIEPVDV